MGEFIRKWTEDVNWVNEIDITNMISSSNGKWGIALDMLPNDLVDLRYYCDEDSFLWSLKFDVKAKFN